MPWQKFLRDALILWATIDPISTLLIFISLTSRQDSAARRRTALRAVVMAGAVLLGSAVAGQFILVGMGISMLAFQVAGGVVLFLFALQLIFGNINASAPQQDMDEFDPAVYPLAFPSIATPGAILAMIVLTDNHLYSLDTQVVTVAIAMAILLITYVLIRRAQKVLSLISEGGAELLVRLMGLLLASLSVQLILDAVRLY
jgi:multiple antibiotic resistance protein